MEVELPEWLKPGSPTPFEIGLKGIGTELQNLSKMTIPNFSTQAAGGFGAGQQAPAMQPISVSVSVGNVSSDIDINNLAYRVADEISRRQRR